MSSLTEAGWNGDLYRVKELISKGVDLDDKEVDGCTALMYASMFGYLLIVQELIRSGVNVNTRNVKNQTALFFAAQNNHLSIVEELVRNDANVNAADIHGDIPLISAAMFGHASTCIFLLLNGADATIRCDEKNFLQWACYYGSTTKEQFMKEIFCTKHVTEEMMNGSLADKVARIHFARREALIWMMVCKRKRHDPVFYAITRDIAKLIANKILQD